MLSRTQAGSGGKVKQEQEEISHNQGTNTLFLVLVIVLQKPGRNISGKCVKNCVRHGELLHDAPAPPADAEEALQLQRGAHVLAHAVPDGRPPVT